jgi:NAD-dependent SIR2 family protein deacetylase
MDDSVQVRCPKCKSKFRDRARRVVPGYSRECPQCEVVLFFEESVPKPDIKAALKDAERVRRALRREEENKVVKTTFVRAR